VAGFVRERCELGPEFEVKKEELYSAFVRYCEEVRMPPFSKRTFTMRLTGRVSLVTVRHHGDPKEYWRGIRLKKGGEGEVFPPKEGGHG